MPGSIARMRRTVTVLVVLAMLVLTVVVFLRIDSTSHSASDTLRPFVILMTPVWAAVLLLLWRVRRATTRS
jgi:hypothetical protein